MTNVFICGGAGFIGSRLVNVCLENHCRVWVYDDFSTGCQEFLPAHNRSLHIVEGDILDAPSLHIAMSGCEPDVLIHLAAIHHIPTCESKPEEALRVNVEGTQHVLNACAQHALRRIVFASSGAVYDPSIPQPLSEISPVQTQGIYAISKLAGEQLLHHHVARYHSQGVIARLFNTVGPRETNAHLVPDIMKQLVANSRQIRLGNLHPRRDYVHVGDVAEALFVLASAPLDYPIETFNVGSGREYSVQELVGLCSHVIGESIEVISEPALQRPVDRPGQLADISKLHQKTGWHPRRTLEQALGEIWTEYIENGRPMIQTSVS